MIMSAERLILEYLLEIKNKPAIRHAGVRLGFLRLPDFKYYKYQTLANRCSILKNSGYIKEINGTYFITYKGEEYLSRKEKMVFKKFEANKTNKDPKDLLLLYDVPEDKKAHRDWLRRELINFNYIMIQRSVWVGPSPLPKEFTEYLKSIGLKDSIKTFKLEKGFTTTK